MPVLALSDSAKALIANASDDILHVRRLCLAAGIITGGMMLVWIALAPAFPAFARAMTDDPAAAQWAVTAFGAFSRRPGARPALAMTA